MDLADLQRLVDAFEASDWNEIHLEVDGVEVHLSAVSGNSGQSDASRPRSLDGAPAAAAAATPAAAAPAAAPAPEGVTGTPFATPGSGIGAAPTAPKEGEPVPAPSPGIFWRSPAPGQPPFVEVGTRVEPDTVVCIVELMKLMNRVSAGVAGVVTALPVGNGVPVEKGEPIVYIQPGRA
jgi:acetyl-CoA carboxylase biotin carboxyl carrier protein